MSDSKKPPENGSTPATDTDRMSPGTAAESGTTAVLRAVQAGDEATFAAHAERYRRQLRVHCYRMLGSADDAEDLVQETFLRAWRGRTGFEGRSSFRTWLYRIATNACLNTLERSPRRIMPQDVSPPVTATSDASEARAEPPWAPELPWLQPFPDALLEPAAPRATQPDALAVSRETIELAFLLALQHLPPKQRAILILREVLGWSAQETAEMLDSSVQSVNAALQRARTAMRTRRAALQHDVPRAAAATDSERVLLQRFMDAWERKDAHALTALLREDARWAMPPAPLWFDGRQAIVRLFELFPLDRLGDIRMVATGANMQPAAAGYIRSARDSVHRLTGVMVLRIDGSEIAEITSFAPPLLSAFRLPSTLEQSAIR